MDRWPGRGVIDREGGPHVDNLLRLVEIKFPGDDWGPGQEADYQLIAGEFKERMSVIDVSDCNGELEKVRQRVLKDVPMRETEQQKKRERVPIRTVEPIPHPVWYEDWWNWVERHGEEAGEAVGEGAAALWDATKRGYATFPKKPAGSCMNMRRGCSLQAVGFSTRQQKHGSGLTNRAAESPRIRPHN